MFTTLSGGFNKVLINVKIVEIKTFFISYFLLRCGKNRNIMFTPVFRGYKCNSRAVFRSKKKASGTNQKRKR